MDDINKDESLKLHLVEMLEGTGSGRYSEECGDVEENDKSRLPNPNAYLPEVDQHVREACCKFSPRMKGDGRNDLEEGIGGDQAPKEVGVGETNSVPWKNLVIDYKSLRKQGYFLEKPQGDKNAVSLEGRNSCRRLRVQRWLNSLPDDPTSWPGDVSDRMAESSMLQQQNKLKTVTLEDRFKNLILNEESSIRYTSELTETLRIDQLDGLLEIANEKINQALEKLRKDNRYREHDYVSGTVAFPESWTKNLRIKGSVENSNIRNDPSFLSWIKSWFPDILSKNGASTQDTKKVSESQVGQLVMKPYHGPTLVNGAVIKAGSTNGNTLFGRHSFSGRIVEEVKTFLKTIHIALRQTAGSSQPLSTTADIHPVETDPEIRKLTELIRKARLSKKSTLKKTVFVLKNPIDRSGPRPRQRHRRRRHTLFRRYLGHSRTRTHCGAIQGVPHGIVRDQQLHFRIVRSQQDLSCARRMRNHHRVFPFPEVLNANQNGNQQNENQSINSSHAPNSQGGFLTSLTSFVRSIMPFQTPSPAVPAYQNLLPPSVLSPDNDGVIINSHPNPQELHGRIRDNSIQSQVDCGNKTTNIGNGGD